MRVGVVVYGDVETTTGGFLYDRKLIERLRNAGAEVTVVELPWRSYPRGLADNLDPRLARRLRGFDLLVEDELCHPSLVGHNAAVDAPVVAIVHHLRSSERWPAWQRPIYRTVERRYLRSVDAAVYVSETTGAAAEDLAGRRPAVVVPPAGDRFDPELTDAAIAARADRDPFRIAFVGSLIPRKGLHHLLDGLARVAGDWRLAVVGAPTDRAYTRRIRRQARELEIADAVTFEGRLSDEALADRLAESHLLAVPSTCEGYGIVYVEGMGFGLPPLATTAGGATELVTHGEDGLLVPPSDPGAIASATERVMGDRERLAAMCLAARRRYERHPDWDESMANVERFLRSVVREREPREVWA
ncbi:glycosyltransferase family 1 protein [Halobacteriales archaeon QS_1_67_19]|nr:MAG: glycosyltransferase family 1 protein [Halobacteriales archaeon QS_1_67_19]